MWTFIPGKGGISRQLKPSEIKPWAEARRQERDENLGHDGPGAQCLPSGFLAFGLVKVVPTPGWIAFCRKTWKTVKSSSTAASFPKDPNPAWMGYSVGPWEGDTLVVEGAGCHDRTWLEQSYPHTENLRLTERSNRADFGHMSIEVTFSDPAIHHRPWTSKIAGAYTADTDLLECVYAENEKDRVHSIGKKSNDTRHRVKLPPEVLSKYAGHYDLRAKELTGFDLAPFTVRLEDDE